MPKGRIHPGVGVYLLLATLALAGCGNDPHQQAFAAYEKSREALAAGDLEALRALVSGEHREQLEGPGAAMALELAQAAMPQDLRLVDSALADGEVTLSFVGRSILGDDESRMSVPATGRVRMVEEAGGWKVAQEDWSMELDRATPIFDVRPFMHEGQRPVALKVLEGHASGATGIVHTPNGQHLVTTSYGDYSLRVWDVGSGQQIAARTLESRPTSLALSADGRSVLTADVKGDVVRWPLGGFGELGEPETILSGAGQHATPSPDGRWLAVTSYDAPLSVYDLETRSVSRTLAGTEKLRSASFSPNGEQLAGSEGNRLLLWDTASWSMKIHTFDDVSPSSSNGPVSFSADGRYLGVPCGDSSIIVFDVEKRRVKHNFFVSNVAAGVLEFSPDGSLFATAQNNQQINLWGIEDHKRVGYIISKKANASALRFSPDGRYLIAGHEDREIVFWGVAGSGETAVAPKAQPPPAAALPLPAQAAQAERMTLLSRTNHLGNPNANQHQQSWKTRGEASVEACAPGNPCFVTRWDGSFVGTALLPPDAAGRTLLLIGTAAAERAHERDGDQTGESYIHGYGESVGSGTVRGQHYSAPTMRTTTRQPNAWQTLWGVFPVREGIRKVSVELRQADGSSAKTGSASRFDDLGVFLFDNEFEARAFVARYEREVGRVASASAASAAQPPASPAPAAAPAPRADPPAASGSAIVSCRVQGRVVFTSRAQCAQQGGR